MKQKHENNRKIITALEQCLINFRGGIEENVQEGTVPAELHEFYREQQRAEGKLLAEYDIPLSADNEVNQRKNVVSAKGTVTYWLQVAKCNPELDFSEVMSTSVDYKTNRGDQYLETGAESQHMGWGEFALENQSERVIPGNIDLQNLRASGDPRETRAAVRAEMKGLYSSDIDSNPKLRQGNFVQLHESYAELDEPAKDQDRLAHAVITNAVLVKAGFESQIDFRTYFK